MNRESERTFI